MPAKTGEIITDERLIELAHKIMRGIVTLAMVCARYGDNVGQAVYNETLLYKWRGNRPMWKRRVR